MLPSGRQPVFTNRVSWAVMHMERAGLLERVRRAVYRLTVEGERRLAQAPAQVDLAVAPYLPGLRRMVEEGACGVAGKEYPRPHCPTNQRIPLRRRWTVPPGNCAVRWKPTC